MGEIKLASYDASESAEAIRSFKDILDRSKTKKINLPLPVPESLAFEITDGTVKIKNLGNPNHEIIIDTKSGDVTVFNCKPKIAIDSCSGKIFNKLFKINLSVELRSSITKVQEALKRENPTAAKSSI